MGKGKGGKKPEPQQSSDRKNNKAPKKSPKVFDLVKRRLVTKEE